MSTFFLYRCYGPDGDQRGNAMSEQSAESNAGCQCPPCPGRGNDGHGMTHCAECCFGTGVEADIDCPTHGQKPLLGLRVHLDPALPPDVVELRNYLGETVGRFNVNPPASTRPTT